MQIFKIWFFQVIFDFRFFRIFQGFKKYYFFFFFFSAFLFFFFFFSIPFLIHCKPSTIPKHKSYYNVYDIYIIIQLHFTRQLLQAFQDLQPFRFCSRSDGKAEPAQYYTYLYYIMHNSITVLYAVNYAILTNNKNIKKVSTKVLTIVLTYAIIKSQQRQATTQSLLHFNTKCSIEKHKNKLQEVKSYD